MARQTLAAMEETKESIIKVAMALFLSQGIGNTTMKQVSDGVGISLRTIYRYFDDKDQLASTIACIQREQLEDIRHASSLTMGTGFQRLQDHLAFLLHYQCLMSTLRSSRFLAEYDYYCKNYTDPKVVSSRMSDITKNYENLIVGFLRLGQEDGSIRKEIKPRRSATMFVSLYIQTSHKMAVQHVGTIEDNIVNTDPLKTFFEHYLWAVEGDGATEDTPS